MNPSYSIDSHQSLAILGYGSQGRALALNLKDQGYKVLVGQRKNSTRYQTAMADGWQEGLNLFDPLKAAQNAQIIFYLFSDAGQIAFWPSLKTALSAGKTLVFAHGFLAVFSNETQFIPPSHVDVILVAPKGSGASVRQKFLQKIKFKASVGVQQNASGLALEKAKALTKALGGIPLFDTTFENETYSDLVSERGVILGGLMALMEAQFEVLIQNGHSPEEAYNDTVEELTDWLSQMIGEIGFDGVLKNCSQTAQWGALKWLPLFKEALNPVFLKLYQSVKDGTEAKEVIGISQSNELINVQNEALSKIENSLLWKTGQNLRRIRSERT